MQPEGGFSTGSHYILKGCFCSSPVYYVLFDIRLEREKGIRLFTYEGKREGKGIREYYDLLISCRVADSFAFYFDIAQHPSPASTFILI